jgi:hypothetical protein
MEKGKFLTLAGLELKCGIIRIYEKRIYLDGVECTYVALDKGK